MFTFNATFALLWYLHNVNVNLTEFQTCCNVNVLYCAVCGVRCEEVSLSLNKMSNEDK